MEPIKIIRYEEKYKDKLIKFNKTENNKDEKDFSDYILLTLEDNILAQLRMNLYKEKDFYRFLDLKISDNIDNISHAIVPGLKQQETSKYIDEFIQYAIKQTNGKIFAFVTREERELVGIYKRNGFELADHPFNKMKRELGYVLIKELK